MGTSKISKQGAVQRTVLDIPANTYNTYALALAAMYTAWQGLSEAERFNSFIIKGSNLIIFRADLMKDSFALYTRAVADSSTSAVIIQGLGLKNAKYTEEALKPSGYSTTDKSTLAQADRLTLYTIC